MKAITSWKHPARGGTEQKEIQLSLPTFVFMRYMVHKYPLKVILKAVIHLFSNLVSLSPVHNIDKSIN